MAFIDDIQIHIKAGDGGNGVVRWRREKFKPMSGPGGGDGGRGGDVYIEAVSDMSYLQQYQYEKKFTAESGEPGGNFGKEGKNGHNLTMKVPVGSLVKNIGTGEIFDISTIGDRVKILTGGRGGFGNEHFKSSRNTTPYESTPGTAGEAADFNIELRLIADVGLVGLPSAGKSSLLNGLTNAHSKVAEYHFTTLEPHLGKFHEFIIADIPGLIEGASSGKGLGHKFLRHIQRTRLLVHMISFEHGDDMVSQYEKIRKELEQHDEELAEKEEIILLTKTDLVDATTVTQAVKKFESFNKPVYALTQFEDEEIKAFGDALVQILRNDT